MAITAWDGWQNLLNILQNKTMLMLTQNTYYPNCPTRTLTRYDMEDIHMDATTKIAYRKT